MFLCVDSDVDYERLARVHWDDVMSALGGTGMGLGALKDRAGIFEGTIHVRARGNGNRISMLLFDPLLS